MSNKDMSDNDMDFEIFDKDKETNFYNHANDMVFDSAPDLVTEEQPVKSRGKYKPRKGRMKQQKANAIPVDAEVENDNNSDVEGFQASDYCDSEDERMTVSSEDEIACPYPEFNEKTDMLHPKFEKGILFSSAATLQHAIRTHAITERRPIQRTPNMGSKVQFTCQQPCEWKVYASKYQKSDSYQIKTFHGHHTCQPTFHQEQISSAWIAWKYEDEIRMNINWELQAFQIKVINDLNCDVSDQMIYRAKMLALDTIKGNHVKQFAQLWDYLNEVKKAMPQSSIYLDCEDKEPGQDRGRFKRLYICLAPLRKGFLEGCRPIICLDGCHLKGPFGGQLLTAVGVDANDGMYLFAWAVVDAENTENWRWFMQFLRQDINMENSGSFTFISDKQKGLINALEEYCPDAEHRFCVMHLYQNMWKDHKAIALRQLLWAAARSRKDYFFEKNMNRLKKLNKKCYEWLIQKPKSQWSRSGFRCTSTGDMFVNNHCEVFNSAIRKYRHLPIITMLKEIQRGVMIRIQKRREKILQINSIFCPNPIAKLQTAMEKAPGSKADFNGKFKFSVKTRGGYEVVVNLEDRTCACRKWQLSGVPCLHVVACYYKRAVNPEVGIHDMLTSRKYLETYMHFIEPINGEEFWEKTTYPPPLPPNVKVPTGRPKRKRSKKNDVQEDNTHLKRRNTSGRCGYCRVWSHNVKTCQAKKNDTLRKEAEAAVASINVDNISAERERNVEGVNLTQPPLAVESQPIHPSQPSITQSQTTEASSSNAAVPNTGKQIKQIKRRPMNLFADVTKATTTKGFSKAERKDLLRPSQ